MGKKNVVEVEEPVIDKKAVKARAARRARAPQHHSASFFLPAPTAASPRAAPPLSACARARARASTAPLPARPACFGGASGAARRARTRQLPNRRC
jgi:hypothetical protein